MQVKVTGAATVAMSEKTRRPASGHFSDLTFESGTRAKADSANHFEFMRPDGIACRSGGVEHHLREGAVSNVIMIGF
jgi:hypothetical protein